MVTDVPAGPLGRTQVAGSQYSETSKMFLLHRIDSQEHICRARVCGNRNDGNDKSIGPKFHNPRNSREPQAALPLHCTKFFPSNGDRRSRYSFRR